MRKIEALRTTHDAHAQRQMGWQGRCVLDEEHVDATVQDPLENSSRNVVGGPVVALGALFPSAAPPRPGSSPRAHSRAHRPAQPATLAPPYEPIAEAPKASNHPVS